MSKILTVLFFMSGIITLIYTAGNFHIDTTNVLLTVFKLIFSTALIHMGLMGFRVNDCTWIR